MRVPSYLPPHNFTVRQKPLMHNTHTNDHFDLARFVLAQDGTFHTALSEIKSGLKRHTGCGTSSLSFAVWVTVRWPRNTASRV
ncbi:hypothetical protein [Leptothermofonsia sp. ETS-13]|uniref:hypothetical protein n=1 Tax=Leptothermofonsia sp. ETS-13 TaxID=3035696 RepID=UPI003BA39918